MFYSLDVKIRGKLDFQKLQNLWVAKALMSSYILCKILSFLTRVAQKYSIHRAQIPCIETVNRAMPVQYSELMLSLAPSETVSLMLMRQFL